jgi:two-component system, chemotaxis family, chemotaxis protein CheY
MARVLVVEDDPTIREYVLLALSDEGYDVMVAPDGLVALEFIRDYRPDLILLDMRMPVMDGWEFAREYRERPGPHAPVVAMTAAVDASRWAEEIGAADVLSKPFDLDDLLRIVERSVRPDGQANAQFVHPERPARPDANRTA